MRFYRRPEVVALPYEVALQDAGFSPPSGPVKGSFLRDFFDHGPRDRNSSMAVGLLISPGKSPLSGTVPGKR
jgi:hypothetical protein